jgi:DNA polymerase (family 10)
MDNYDIAEQIGLLAKLMDIHGDDAFKAKSYASAAFSIEKYPHPLSSLPANAVFAIKGIGQSVGKKIIELIEQGELPLLKDYIAKTPAGVLEMMNIKGLGPKKINTLWKDIGIDTIEELEEACKENRIATIKGFGAKTQEKILESIAFQQENEGMRLYAQVESFAHAFTIKLQEHFPGDQFQITGDFRRQLEVIKDLEWVTTIDKEPLKKHLLKADFTLIAESEHTLTVSVGESIHLKFYITSEEEFAFKLFETSSSKEFILAWQNAFPVTGQSQNEEAIFASAGLPYIPSFLREKATVLEQARQQNSFTNLIQTNEIKGLIHAHSDWSDGAYTLEQMANDLIQKGFEYLVISDHSKAAYYAGGLSEQEIIEQHKLIDQLNQKLAPFKIFKSIECDILSDGALDYTNNVLASFDLVIASIHSNLDMDEDKAMLRLMGAITNPYVTIMGHLTGRRLLRRKGYPIDHKAIINACAAHNTAIEINASPERLDIDWRWVEYALQKNVLLSINPDAHTLDEFQNIQYGVLVAQKGGLTKEHNISSFSLAEFEAFLADIKKVKGISK